MDFQTVILKTYNDLSNSFYDLPELEDEKFEKIQTILLRHESDEAMTAMISAIYGKILIAIGITLPVIKALSPESFVTRFNGFYLYLNVISILFMVLTYVIQQQEENRFNRIIKNSHRTNRLKEIPSRKEIRYGSNYLRVGIAGFGIGSMILSGLEVGRFFEIDKSDGCYSVLILLSPLIRMIFVLLQILFIFSTNKLFDDKASHRIIARFGIMHMIATNLCEWIYVLVEETKIDINKARAGANFDEAALNLTCFENSIMRSLILTSSPYLFPCTVEYSLLCSVILAVMWRNICTVNSNQVMCRDLVKKNTTVAHDMTCVSFKDKKVSKFSMDCDNSHKGMFSGILVLVLTIISLIMFFELVKLNIEVAVLQVNIWETVLFGSALSATIACAIILRRVDLRRKRRRLALEHILLLVTQCGVFIYFLFQIFGGYYYFILDDNSNNDHWRMLRMVAPIAALIQSSCQTILILDAWHRQCKSPEQNRKKPGRELVTFLLITNLALWIINRLKNNNAEFHPMQMEFYGVWSWTIITHVSMPLVVCYRFQSTVCLYEIWKHVYKRHVHFSH